MGQILDQSLRLVFDNFGLMVAIAAISVVPTQLLSITMGTLAATPEAEMTAATAVGMSGMLLAILLASLVLGPLVTGALTHAISERHLGRTPDLGTSLGLAWSRFPTILLVSMVTGLFIFLGMLLFIVPGLILALGYAVIVPAVMLEGLGARDARLRSWELMKGFKGKAALVILVLVLVFIIATSVPAALAVAVGLDGPVAEGVVTALVSLVTTPLFSTSVVLLYYDARVRKESFDLELLGQSLERARG